MLSSDVSAGYDPAFAEALRKRTLLILEEVSFSINSRCPWKIRLNDANASMWQVRRIFDDHKVCFRLLSLVKVDVGGSGDHRFYRSSLWYGSN